jgi:RNA polymerase sigma factor (sigma-70 family)
MLPGENKQLLWNERSDEVFFHLVTEYYNDLFKYGIRFTADIDNTKEILNQFFLHAWTQRDKMIAAQNRKAYMLVSFKRFMINYLRRAFPFKSVADFPEEPMEHSYEDYIIRFQDNEDLKNALHASIQELPGRQKELLLQRFYENLSYEEMASRNSLSVRTIYNKIHLALKKLRTMKLLQQVRKNSILF